MSPLTKAVTVFRSSSIFVKKCDQTRESPVKIRLTVSLRKQSLVCKQHITGYIFSVYPITMGSEKSTIITNSKGMF